MLMAAALLSAASISAQAEIQIQVSAVANLYYQMDCLTGRRSCSTAAVETLWQQQGWLTEEANQALNDFARIRDRYQTDVWLAPDQPASTDLLAPPVPDLGPDPNHFFSLADRLNVAALESRSIQQLRHNLNLVMTPGDSARMTALVAQFYPAFQSWWSEHAEPAVTPIASDIATLLEQQIDPLIASALRFYGHGLNPVTAGLRLNLMYRPGAAGTTSGQQIENHSVVEVMSGESAADRIGVVIHELAHYLFGLAPDAWHRLRLEGALQANSTGAASAVGLMDEALATAIGNGALEQRLQKPDVFAQYRDRELSFYNDPLIDAAGKLLLEKVQTYLNQNRPMDSQFVTFYFDQVTAALDAPLNTLEARLTATNVVLGKGPYAGVWSQMRAALGTRSVWTYGNEDDLQTSILARHPYLHGVVLAAPDEIPDLLEALGERPTAPSRAPVVCLLQRRAGPGLLYVIALDGPAPAADLINQMREADACPTT